MIPARSALVRLTKAQLVDLLAQLTPPEGMELGGIGLQVQAALAEMAEQGPLPAVDRAKGATALALAEAIDSGKAGLATAGIAKELRTTLGELEQACRDRNGGDSDPADDFDAELERLSAG